MKSITFVTGNANKVKELGVMTNSLNFTTKDIDIDEIQSLNLDDIVTDKAKKAYRHVMGPVIVDDVSAGLDSLKGLPGPFIKFFNQSMGPDSLYKLSQSIDDKVTITCLAAYYDGTKLIIGRGVIRGILVSPRGSNRFGFDCVVVPDGQKRTMAEMTDEEKILIGHRGLAFRSLIDQIEELS
jgi:inosine triphosphate pyrophosphatase